MSFGVHVKVTVSCGMCGPVMARWLKVKPSTVLFQEETSL